MPDNSNKDHWEKIYETKNLSEVSWYQPIPGTSLDWIRKQHIARQAAIIDIGGGDSFLSEYLLKEGFEDLSVLDISSTSIQKAKKRLGDNQNSIHWIVRDILEFRTEKKYDLWHDRACFHFLINPEDIRRYVEIAWRHTRPEGILIMGTFSKEGPTKCSGIEIKQYTAERLSETFSPHFTLIESEYSNHLTPFGTTQNFLFCSLKRNS